MRIRLAEADDAEQLLALRLRLDDETAFMLYEPGERQTTVEYVQGRYVDEFHMAKLLEGSP